MVSRVGYMIFAVCLASAPGRAGAQNYACPPAVPPVPECAAPARLTPVLEGCGSCAQEYSYQCGTCQSADCCKCQEKSSFCCKPLINIDFSKHSIKSRESDRFRSPFGGMQPFLGTAAPQGYVVSSMPVIPLNISAMPVSFGTASSGVTEDQLAAALRRLQKENQAALAAAADPNLTCNDPCGSIKQLQTEVGQLREITRNLAAAVEKLSDDYVERQNN